MRAFLFVILLAASFGAVRGRSECGGGEALNASVCAGDALSADETEVIKLDRLAGKTSIERVERRGLRQMDGAVGGRIGPARDIRPRVRRYGILDRADRASRPERPVVGRDAGDDAEVSLFRIGWVGKDGSRNRCPRYAGIPALRPAHGSVWFEMRFLPDRTVPLGVRPNAKARAFEL